MTYFVYKMFPGKRLESAGGYSSYRDAKREARSLREALAPDADYTIKIIFGGSAQEAERLLTEEREPRPAGEE